MRENEGWELAGSHHYTQPAYNEHNSLLRIKVVLNMLVYARCFRGSALMQVYIG